MQETAFSIGCARSQTESCSIAAEVGVEEEIARSGYCVMGLVWLAYLEFGMGIVPTALDWFIGIKRLRVNDFSYLLTYLFP